MSSIDSLIEDFFKQKNIIKDCQLQPYNIKLLRPWKTTSSRLLYRQGILIKLTLRDSFNTTITAIGECAPMPEIGTETLAQAQNFLVHRIPDFIGKPFDKELFSDLKLLPACHFALESLLLLFLSKQQQQSIAQLLNPIAAQTIKTNIMLGSLDDDIILRTKNAELEGFNCIKLKLGLNDIKVEVKKLHQLFEQIAATTLVRLDANKCWSLKETQFILNELKVYQHQIDSIEEPLLNYDCYQYQKLQSQTAIKLALDESLSLALADKQYPVKRMVLKPMVLGSVIRALELAKTAEQQKIETIITSTIETAYGLEVISHACAALNNGQYHGIATASWLEDTLIPSLEIKNSIITINSPSLEDKNI